MRVFFAVGAAAMLAAGCSRSFPKPNQEPQLQALAVVDRADPDGQVLERSGAVPVVRGALTVHVAAAAGTPVSAVEFFTPGRLPEVIAGPDFTWETRTADIYPEGGVLTVTATPLGDSGQRGPAKQLSVIVDNAAPNITLVTPADGQLLRTGATPVAVRVKDATPPVAVTIGGQDASPSPDDAELFTATLDARDDVDGGALSIDVVATDDVGNRSELHAHDAVTRVVARLYAPGSILEDEDSSGSRVNNPITPFADGLFATSAGAATWLYRDGSSLYRPLDATGVALGFTGSGGLAVTLALPTLADAGIATEGKLVRDAQVVSTIVGGPATSTASLSWDTNGLATCMLPNLVESGAETLDCFFADGGHSARALAMLPAGSPVANLLVLGDAVWLTTGYGDDVYPYRVTRFHLEDLSDLSAPAASEAIGGCFVEDRGGALCTDTTGTVVQRYDATSNQAASVSGIDDCQGAGSKPMHCLATTPAGGLVIEDDAPDLGALVEYGSGAPVRWGCLPDATVTNALNSDAWINTRATLTADGHLYVASPINLGRNVEVLAFTAPGKLAWKWSEPFANGVADSAIHLAVDDTDGGLLWLTLDGSGEAVALSRRDPAQLPGGDGCAQP